jgi:hypothetical protein
VVVAAVRDVVVFFLRVVVDLDGCGVFEEEGCGYRSWSLSRRDMIFSIRSIPCFGKDLEKIDFVGLCGHGQSVSR